jgi:flagellar motor switch protein FliN
MTSTIAPELATLLEAAAAAATRALTIGEPVTHGELEAEEELAGAVTVAFAGSLSGEFAIFVDEEVSQALTQDGRADLAAALTPAVEAVAAAIGSVTAGVVQVVDARMARNRLTSFADNGAVALRGAAGVRAAVAIGVERITAGGAGQPTAAGFERLDLLRGVEMQASAELGRAKMTVNELLNLRAGAVVELDRAAGDPADLYVNGRLMARGEVVVVDENYALRITQIVSDESGR